MNTHRSNNIKSNLIKNAPIAGGRPSGSATNNLLNTSLLSNISHELRTPVNVIVGFTNLLNDPTYSDEQKKFFIREINHNSKELLRLVDNLIFSAKIDAEEFEPEMCMYPLIDILSEMQSGVDEMAQNVRFSEIKIVFQKNFIPNYYTLFTDSKKLIKAFLFLVENALKLSTTGPIECGAEIVQNAVRFVIRDDGSIINQKYLVQVIDDFQHEKKPVLDNDQPQEIGLAIAEKLVRLLGGKLTIKSTFGKGSSFFFTIPLLVEKPV